jgi:hypothetical protein
MSMQRKFDRAADDLGNLQFRKTDAPQPGHDGHHVPMYVTDFRGPYRQRSKPFPGSSPRQRRRFPLRGRRSGA